MNMYQLLEVIGDNAGASHKARGDINIIANNVGFKTIAVRFSHLHSSTVLKVWSKLTFEYNLIQVLSTLEPKSVLLIQLPFLNLANLTHKNILRYCVSHHIKLVCLIHDVNELRGTNAKNNQPFYDLLYYASAIISHNQAMSMHLINKGVDPEKIINLGVFDYLLSQQISVGKFNKQIIIAGNLDVEKVGYLQHLNKIKGCKIVLYGPNYTMCEMSGNIEYKGIVNASDLPYKLNEGFGLVWDGDSVESCTGLFGNYLKYNNPHKLSMYIASGLPIIIWNHAAEAPFVQESQIGVTIGSLLELEEFFLHIDEERYNEYVINVAKIQQKIIAGYYVKTALEKALRIIM